MSVMRPTQRRGSDEEFFMSRRVLVTLLAASACICTTRPALADGCPGSLAQSHGPDVIIARLTGPSNFTFAGTREALTFGSDACNLGDQQVLWEPCPATTHPVFGGNLYRWSTVNGGTRFEQVGQSW